MTATKKDDAIIELRNSDIDIVSGASPGHVILGLGMLYMAYKVHQHIQQQQR